VAGRCSFLWIQRELSTPITSGGLSHTGKFASVLSFHNSLETELTTQRLQHGPVYDLELSAARVGPAWASVDHVAASSSSPAFSAWLRSRTSFECFSKVLRSPNLEHSSRPSSVRQRFAINFAYSAVNLTSLYSLSIIEPRFPKIAGSGQD
jgi:hypothetical protein